MKTYDESYYFFRRAASPVHIDKLIPSLESEQKLKEMSKSIGMTYANLTQAVNDAIREKIVVRDKHYDGNLELTEKGKALCKLCKALSVVILQWDEEKTINYLNDLKFGNVIEDKSSLKSGSVIKPVGDVR